MSEVADTERASEDRILLDRVIGVLRNCYDPEIPVDIYELGLVYDVKAEHGAVQVTMTLTSPMCPVAESLPVEVEERIRYLADVRSVAVNVVWEPPWNPSMMTEAAKLQLGMF
jgi:FeS assembly SUF system protein